MTNRVIMMIGMGVLAVACVAWYAFGSSKIRQFEVVTRTVCYRAAVANLREFTDVEAKVSPAYLMIGMHEDEQESEPWKSIIEYGWRNRIRSGKFIISPDGALSDEQVRLALRPFTEGKLFPVLVISADAAYSGMIAAAYRLRIEKMPLDEVERLTELPDAPAETTQRIREFARRYDAALRAAATAQGTPTTDVAGN